MKMTDVRGDDGLPLNMPSVDFNKVGTMIVAQSFCAVHIYLIICIVNFITVISVPTVMYSCSSIGRFVLQTKLGLH